MKDFNPDEADKFLSEREKKRKEELEQERKSLLQKTISILEQEFEGTAVEVYLVGSIIRPFQFSEHSDVDIVLKNFSGDRFDLWPKLERAIGRDVEVILFENCSFQDFVVKHGFKVR